jgi:hypothetical protein
MVLTSGHMKTIEIINLDGQPAAIAVDGSAIVAEHVPAQQLTHVQAKALYALQIQAGERPGPYNDDQAEHYARTAARAASRSEPHAVRRWARPARR